MRGKGKLALIGLAVVLGLSALGFGINTALVAASDNTTDGSSTASVSDNETDVQTSRHEIFVSKVAEKLGLDEETVATAMDEARDEMRLEALQERLQEAVEEGTITQDEADQILQWEQSRPEALDKLGGPGMESGMGGRPMEHRQGCHT
jgi:hypothetical protein